MSGTFSVGGLISNLDIDGIISKLDTISRTPVKRLENRKAVLNNKAAAWSEANTRLLAVQQKAEALSKLRDQISVSTVSSDASLVVSANNTAVAGNYAFTVNSLSTYHQLVSQEFSDQDVTSVGSGTYSITVDGKTTDLTVNDLSLTGLRDAINNSGAGVKAFIVSDGAATPKYRLMMTSQTLGSAGQISLNSTLAGGSAPSMSELKAATDTTLTFGTGANTFTVTRTGNTLTDVIPGLTMTLKDDAVGKSLSVNATVSTKGVKTAIQDFVNQYNGLVDYIAAQNMYDPDTGNTGVLFGEYRLTQVRQDLASVITDPNPNLPSSLNSILQLGIKHGDDGKLAVDNEVLDQAISTNLQGVLNLFQDNGVASNSAITFLGATTNTKTSGASGYAVNITETARQSQLTLGGVGGAGLVAALAQDETLTINGTAVALTQGMTPQQVINAINAKSSTTNVVATLTDPNGLGEQHLTLTQTQYGLLHNVAVSSSLALATAGSTGIGTGTISEIFPGPSNTGVRGRDVAGTINGQAAIGTGQDLKGIDGDVKDLILKVTATAPGEYGTVVFSRGLGSRFKEQLSFVTSSDGVISQLKSSIEDQIEALDEDIAASNAAVDREMTRMRTQFNNMEIALGKLQSQASNIAGLIGQLPSYGSDSNS